MSKNDPNRNQPLTRGEFYDFCQDLTKTILEAVGLKFDEIDKRFNQMDKRFDAMNLRLSQMDKRFDDNESDIDTLIRQVDRIEDKLDLVIRDLKHNVVRKKPFSSVISKV